MAAPSEPAALMDRYYTTPQTLVRIGRRRRLNLLIAGEGAPTVIFAPGGGCTTLEWGRVQHPIALKTRTVAFDYAGLGFSDPGPLPRTGSAIVNDLRAALKAADIPPPYVLAGWSIGGLYMRLFAFRYPQEVVGMVMVDSSSEHQGRRFFEATGDSRFAPTRRELSDRRRDLLRIERLARAGGLAPGTPEYDQWVGKPLPTVTAAVNAARVAQRTSPGFWRALRSEGSNMMSTTSDEVEAARRPLGDMPLIVLTAGKAVPMPDETAETLEARRRVWRTMHDEIAALSSRGEQRTIEDAGHGIQVDRPDAVIGAIEEVLALARAGGAFGT
jgi:pimeloyl-ACP methyl ester carboxylesterase